MLSNAKGRGLRSVQLLLKYDPEIRLSHLQKISESFRIVDLITIHSSPYEKYIESKKNENTTGFGNILYIRQVINSCEACGIINMKSLYVPTVQGFMENVQYNGCLNRKISVDENGDIKNCPSMQKSYGNIKEVSLSTALNPDFKKQWKINKDSIEVCRDCEFRYICTDCRAYVSKPGTKGSKPAKCSYDPYTAEWKK